MLEARLLKAIQRSEEAYLLYKEDKKFFQALRILKANKIESFIRLRLPLA